VPPTNPERQRQIAQDERDLARLGYSQQLFREMGGFSNFAISFSIISILTGAVLLFGYGLKFAGPVINSVGWPVVSLFTLCVAASMAELASVYPTAGGLYFWAFRLGGRGWAWLTAWLNMIGQVTITAGINVAAATYIIGAATRIGGWPADVPVPLFGSTTSWYFQLAVMVAIMVPQVIINAVGIRLTARLNDFSVWWHLAGVATIAALLTFLGAHHNPPGFLLQHVTTVTPLEASSVDLGGGRLAPALVIADVKLPSPLFALVPGLAALYGAAPLALVFVLGLLQAQWTYTGYDASAHVAEETVMARLNAAWGVFLSVAVSAVVGYVLLLILTWSIPKGDVAATANDAYPVLQIAYANLGPFAANVVAVIIGGAMWLCVVRLRARRRHAGRGAAPARASPPPHARAGDPRQQRARRADHHLCRRLHGGDVDQHDHALPGLRDPDLPQLAQSPARPRRAHDAGQRALEPGTLGAGGERRRHRLGGVHRGRLRAAAERAGAVDDAAAGGRPGRLLAGVGAAPIRGAGRGWAGGNAV